MKMPNERTVDVFLGIALLTILTGLALKYTFSFSISMPENIEELIFKAPFNLMIDLTLMVLFPIAFQEWWNDFVAVNTMLSTVIVGVGVTLLLLVLSLQFWSQPRKKKLEIVGIMSCLLTLYFGLYSYWYLIQWLNVDSIPSGLFAFLMVIPWLLGFCLTAAYLATKLGLFERSQYDQIIKDITQTLRSENDPD